MALKNIFSRPLNLLKAYHNCYLNKFSLDGLIFFVTDRCNFKCKTCFYINGTGYNTGKVEKELSIDEIRKISSSIGKFSTLLISGGEPFLRDDLAEICEVFYLQNKVKCVHLPTNGFYIDKVYDTTYKILKKCSGINLIIGLPLDGLKETHDKIKGVNGSFEKVVETTKKLDVLKKEFKNLCTYIITVVNNLNLNEIIKLSEFVKNNLPVDDHGPSPVRGTPCDKDLSPPSYKEWDELSEKLMEYHRYWNEKKAGGKVRTSIPYNRIHYIYKLYTHILEGKKLPFKCQAGNLIGVLEPHGDVKLCELTGTVGNVRSAGYDFKAVWFSGKAGDMRKKIKNCTCTHACFLGPSIEMNPLSFMKSSFLGRL